MNECIVKDLRKDFYVCIIFVFLSLLPTMVYSQDVVALIDSGYKVYFSDVQKYVYDHYFDRLYKPKVKGYEAALDQIIRKQLKVLDFFDKRLDQNPQILLGINRIINEELNNEFLNEKIFKKYVNDSTILAAYKDYGKIVYYRQMDFSKGENVSERSLDSLRQMVKSIKELAEKEDFISVSSKFSNAFSQDELLSVNWEESFSRNLYYVIFNLPENTLNILEDARALYIVKIVKIKNNPTPPLDSVKNEIAKVLGIRYSETSLKEFKDLQRKLVGEESVTWNAKGLAQIVQWSNSIPQFYKNVYKDTLQKAISSGDNFIIMESPQVKVDLKKYLYLLNEVLILSREVDFTESDIKSYILEAVKIDLIAQKARSLGLEKKILNPYTRNSALIDGIASLYDQYVIEKQIPPATEAALKIFYQENKDSLYYQLARVNIYVAFASDTAGISKFKDSLAHNVPFERIDKRVFVKRYIRTREGVIQPEKPEDNVVLGKIAFTLSLGDVAGPIEIIENGEKKLALFKCVYKIEEKQLLYEDVKDRIVNDYRQYYLNKIQESTFNQLKVKYSVQIYDDTFHQILTSLKIQ